MKSGNYFLNSFVCNDRYFQKEERKMKKLIAMILALCLCTGVFAGCGSGESVECYAYAAKLLTAGDTVAPTIQPACNDELSAAADDFAAALLLNTMEEGENTLISPLSVLGALALTANGAKGNTLTQMEEAFGMSIDELCAFLQAYNNGGEELNVANSIWLREDYTEKVLPDFLAKNSQWLKSETYSAPFDDRTCTDINNWVSDHTKQRIPQILDRVGQDAVMYLINALAFDGEWADPFEDSYDREFTTAAGTKQTVKTMYHTENVYLHDENAEGFMKYYKFNEGCGYAFVGLLPKPGMSLTEYVTTLRNGNLKALLDSRENTEVHMSMPKFKVEFGTLLNEPLQAMGITDAFAGAADFSGIAGNPGDISISRVIHKTFMEVDEDGTKAAAATVVEATEAAMIEEPEYKEVYLNRPFVYMIVDCEQYLPVFIGAMNEIPQ